MPFDATIYEFIEDQVVSRLDPLTPVVQVQPWPDEGIDFNQAYPKPRISVQCHSSKTGEQLTVAISSADETATVHLFIESRSRRGENGVFDLKRKIDGVINGFKPTGCKRFVPGEFMQDERTQKGVWRYSYLFYAVLFNGQQFDDVMPTFDIPGLGPQ